MKDKIIKLIILEAYTRDVGRAVARIDYKSMDDLGASTGDILEISGRHRSVARCLPLYPTDQGKQTIRVDGLARNNTGMGIGDTLTVRKIKTVPAEKITVMPLESIPPIDERYLADALENVPVIKNDTVMVPYFGGRLTFQIVDTIPNAGVIIDQKTQFTITTQTQGLVDVHNESVHIMMTRYNSKTLTELKSIIEQYEKEIQEKQEKIKTITQNMLKENYSVEDIKKFLDSNLHESLLDTHEKLLHAYRQYVIELESETSRK